jgi:hypothetical protein
MAIVISFAALILSGLSLAWNYRASKRDLMVRTHDQLISNDRQHGRRLLFETCEKGRTPANLSAEDFRSVNNALSWLEFMAVLFDQRHIPHKDALASWGIAGSTPRRQRGVADGYLRLSDMRVRGASVRVAVCRQGSMPLSVV